MTCPLLTLYSELKEQIIGENIATWGLRICQVNHCTVGSVREQGEYVGSHIHGIFSQPCWQSLQGNYYLTLWTRPWQLPLKHVSTCMESGWEDYVQVQALNGKKNTVLQMVK